MPAPAKNTAAKTETKTPADEVKVAAGIDAGAAGDNPTAADTSTKKGRIANHKIVLFRDKQRVVVPAGKKFDFTAEELKGLPRDAVRTPVNENQTAEEVQLQPVVPLTGIASPALGAETGDVGDEL